MFNNGIKMKIILILELSLLLSSCMPIEKGVVKIDIQKNLSSTRVASASIVNNQLIVKGSNLNVVNAIKINGDSFNELFTIESKSSNQIVANSNRAFSIDMTKIFELILSDASASATFPISFDGYWNKSGSTINYSAGNVGIGTTEPTARLDVRDANASGDVFNVHADDEIPYVAKFFNDTYSTTTPAFEYFAYNNGLFGMGTAGAKDFYFFTGGFSGERMRITSSGNVGIGTTSPAHKLDVSDPTQSALYASSGAAAASPSIIMSVNNREGITDGTSALQAFYVARSNVGGGSLWYQGAVQGSNYTGPFIIGHRTGSTAYQEVLRIDGYGNVGIGTSNPGAKLHIAGPAAFENNSANSTGANFSFWKSRNYGADLDNDELGYISFYGHDGTGIYRAAYIAGNVDETPASGTHTVQGRLSFYTTSTGASDSVERMRIDSAGNVGIGTTNPGYPLDVVGDIRSSTGVFATSDRRFKRNILPLDDSTEKIKKIHGVSFNWAVDEYPQKNFPSEKQIGVIAQDVQAVFPELVSKDNNGYLSVNYSSLVVPLMEAFKEQQVQIEKINRLTEALTAENEELKSRLARIESLLLNNK